MMPLARLERVTKRYGDLHALRGITLEIRSGEVFGLLGRNGAGKTTALRILTGLLAPDEGAVEIDGIDVLRQPLEARRRIAFVPDGAPLYSNLSPWQHLELVGRLHALPSATVRSEGERLLAALELAERGNDPVGQFSRGMRQKTALALAILPKPKLLVLDEPLNGLDAPTTAMFKEVLRMWADRGGAVIYTSHLLDVVERVCDRMALIEGGVVAAEGDLEALRRRAGTEGSLEELFRVLTHAADPREQAQRLFG
ncbi:MAG: ABC transporter ATP-binding protein [Planctomycetia bacterium]